MPLNHFLWRPVEDMITIPLPNHDVVRIKVQLEQESNLHLAG